MITFEESIPTTCPYCGMLYNTHLNGEPDSKEELGIEKCRACNMPYVVRQEVVLKVTTHRIDGLQPVEPRIKLEYEADIPTMEEIRKEAEEHEATSTATHPDPSQFLCSECVCIVDLHKMISLELTGGEKVCESCFHSDAYQARTPTDDFIASLPSRTCFRCGQKFNSENPCKWKGEIHCDDCFDAVSHEEEKQPESEKEIKQSKTPDWQPTPGNKNAVYRCYDDFVEVKYGVSGIVKLTWADVWPLVDCNGKLTDEIMAILGKEWTGNKNAAISAFVRAVRAGKIPEAPEVV